MALAGPSKWLDSRKASASFLYSGQPNPRVSYPSSFTMGMYKGHWFFCRSYYLDLAEEGTQRRGSLLTLGIASTTLPVPTLAWLYHLGVQALLPSLGQQVPPASLLAEDEAMRRIAADRGEATGDYLAEIFPRIFARNKVSRLRQIRFRMQSMHRRLANGRNQGLLIAESEARETLYLLAVLLAAPKVFSTRWLRRNAARTVLVSNLSFSGQGQLLMVRRTKADNGLLELTLTELTARALLPVA